MGVPARVLTVIVISLGAAAAGAAERPGWLQGRLTVGADWTRFSLEDSRRLTDHGPDNGNRGNFLGSLWGLDTRESAVPQPFVEYRLVSVVGLGASYDRRRARTLDFSDNEAQTGIIGDGDVEIRGFRLYASARYPNRTRFTPYARVGRARYAARFLVLPSWTGGEPGRVIQVDPTSGWFVAGGGRITLSRHVALEASYERLHVGDVAARAYGDIINRPNQHRNGAFPMSGGALAVGAAYEF